MQRQGVVKYVERERDYLDSGYSIDMGASEGLKASLNLNKNVIDYDDLIPNTIDYYDLISNIDYYDLIPNIDYYDLIPNY